MSEKCPDHGEDECPWMCQCTRESLAVLRTSVAGAMETLEGASMGGVGECGPTVKELDDHVEKTGTPWEGNSDYHTMQRAWKILEGAGQ